MSEVVLVQEVERGTIHIVPVGGALAFGRDGGQSDVACKDPHVSRRHCVLHGQPEGKVRVVDVGRTGTTVRGERVSSEATAGPGDAIVLGTTFALRIVGKLEYDAEPPLGGEPAPPAWLGEYLLLREVGRGGMGVVYEAWDEAKRRRVALKWLKVGGAASDEDVLRFRREAELQQRLRDYPGVARVLEHGTVPGSGELFCVLEFVDGEALDRRIKAGLPRLDGVRLAARIARAVEYAHGLDVLHRDLKPGNVLVNKAGAIRLTDFGLARALDASGRLTATGIMLGTPGFMSPEQIKGDSNTGPATDIYGLGAILYAILTGKAPLKGTRLSDALRNAVDGKFDPPRALDPTIPAALETICLRALARRPEDRHANAGELAEALEGWARAADPAPRVKLERPG